MLPLEYRSGCLVSGICPLIQTDRILRLATFACPVRATTQRATEPLLFRLCGREECSMRRFGANALLWIACSLGLEMPASATIPVLDSAIALQEAKHLDQLPPVVPCRRSGPRR